MKRSSTSSGGSEARPVYYCHKCFFGRGPFYEVFTASYLCTFCGRYICEMHHTPHPDRCRNGCSTRLTPLLPRG